MITHVVCWQLHEPEKNAPLLKEKLEALTANIPEIRSLEVGINAPEADPENYDVVLISTFETMDDLASYAGHPEHVKVVEFLRSIKINRVAIDYPSEIN